MSVVLVTGGYDHKIRFWDATGGSCIKVLPHTTSQVNCISISPDKTLIAVGGNPQIQLFEVNSSSDSPVLVIDGHTSNITTVGFHRDMKWLYSSSEDGTIRTWELRPNSPVCLKQLDCQSPVNTVTLHPNQVEIISGDQNGSLKVWDLAGGFLVEEQIPVPDVAIRSTSVASDGSLLAVASHSGHLFVYAPGPTKGTWYLLKDLKVHEDYLLKCVISPDASCIATASADKTIKLWSTSNYSLQMTLVHHQRWVWDAVFSADSLYMVSVSSDQTGKLWNLKTGEVMKTYVGHSLTVSCVALNDSS